MKRYSLGSLFQSSLQVAALYVALLCSTLLPTSAGVFAADSAGVENDKPVILSWGDSLSAAYGIPVEQGWVSLLQDKLKDSHNVVNGSISGETTIGGRTRLPAALETHQPDYMLLALGANDGLRGLATTEMQKNLQAMIELAQQADTKVILLGIKIPPNYGMRYTDNFDKVFTDLAEQYDLPLHPFFLDRVALAFDLMQDDGLHPTAAAQPMILENIWTVLEAVLMPVEAETDPDNGQNKEAETVSDVQAQ